MKYRLTLIVKSFIGRLFKLYASKSGILNGKNIILMYHRVNAELENTLYDPAMYVTPDTLEMHILELTKHFEIVSVDELLAMDAKYIKCRRFCSLTFDDGWVDNYDEAFPILNKYKVPATVFLTANMIGSSNEFWFHRVWILSQKACAENKKLEFISYFNKYLDFKKTHDYTQDEISNLICELKKLPSDKLDDVVSNAYGELFIQSETAVNQLNWENIIEMQAAGITFGSHGMNHYILTEIDCNEKKREIYSSMEILKQKINLSSVFCYPNGNWDDESLDLVKKAGYLGGITTRMGYNTKDSDPFLLNRIALHDDISNTPDLFWFRIYQSLY